MRMRVPALPGRTVGPTRMRVPMLSGWTFDATRTFIPLAPSGAEASLREREVYPIRMWMLGSLREPWGRVILTAVRYK